MQIHRPNFKYVSISWEIKARLHLTLIDWFFSTKKERPLKRTLFVF